LRVSPAVSARAFVNRRDPRPGKASRPGLAEAVVDVFAAHGFLVWGGDWNFPIDYQHFEAGDRDFAQRLLQATPSEAALLVPLANVVSGSGDWQTVLWMGAVANVVTALLALLVLRPMRRAHRLNNFAPQGAVPQVS